MPINADKTNCSGHMNKVRAGTAFFAREMRRLLVWGAYLTIAKLGEATFTPLGYDTPKYFCM